MENKNKFHKLFNENRGHIESLPILIVHHHYFIFLSIKFHENILKGFQAIERIWNYHCRTSKGDSSKNVQIRVNFLISARHLIMVYTSMKVHENKLNGFQVMERTRIYHCRILNGNNSKTIWTSVMVIVFCTSPDYALYLLEVPWKYLERFLSYRADTIAWRIDRQTDGPTSETKPKK